MIFALFLIALYAGAVAAIVAGLMSPLRKVVPVEGNRETFRLGDFFSLSVLMVPAMAVVSQQYRIMEDVGVASVILAFLMLMTLTFWGGLCQWLSRRGIWQSPKRFVFVSVCIPGILVVAIGGPALLTIFLNDVFVPYSSTGFATLTMGGSVLVLILFGFLIYWLNAWVAAKPIEDVHRPAGKSTPLPPGFDVKRHTWEE